MDSTVMGRILHPQNVQRFALLNGINPMTSSKSFKARPNGQSRNGHKRMKHTSRRVLPVVGHIRPRNRDQGEIHRIPDGRPAPGVETTQHRPPSYFGLSISVPTNDK
jgi:hypothetical protein